MLQNCATKNKAPEKLNKSLGALIKDTEELNKSLVSASARLLDLTAPPLTNLPNDLLAPEDRLGWGLDSDGIPHGHNFNGMYYFVKHINESQHASISVIEDLMVKSCYLLLPRWDGVV